MRHRVAGIKLTGGKDRNKGIRRTLLRQFFTHERIQTTQAKAIAIRSEAEKLITIAKNSQSASDIEKVNARRLVASKLGGGPEVVKKLFDDIGPRFSKRPGGYTRVYHLGPRLGDGAKMVLMELVEE